MVLLPVIPRGSRPAAPGGRSRTAGLRRVLLLLAIALTVLAGPLGRPTPDHAPSDEVFRPMTVTSFTTTAAAAPAR